MPEGRTTVKQYNSTTPRAHDRTHRSELTAMNAYTTQLQLRDPNKVVERSTFVPCKKTSLGAHSVDAPFLETCTLL